ncbi:MAG TPA: phosphate ABC transporter permease subunit PstC [Candidatus Limnocylindrales bacterium]|jgi:phosphate transport system permease protein|nr:phosphate ABC transporter permease subunit PstC [Candidatus Limnocylindrales bacterium]
MTTLTGASRRLEGSPRRHRNEGLVRAFLLGASIVSVAISAGIVLSLIFEAISFVSSIQLSQLVADGWFPRRGMFSLGTVIAGTLIITLIAMALAAPVGLASAVFLSEYASTRVRRVVKPVLEILAGVPSVVLGFFALTWISPHVVQALFSEAKAFSLLAAGLGVGILTIPLVASISEDAMRAVPLSLREASYGLGARRVTTSLRVVVPAAISGIVAALILAISRAIGETMVVAVAAGASGGSLFTLDPIGPGQTLTGAMASLATGSDNVTGNSSAFLSLYFLGFVLFAMTLGLNVLGDIFVRRTRQQY